MNILRWVKFGITLLLCSLLVVVGYKFRLTALSLAGLVIFFGTTIWIAVYLEYRGNVYKRRRKDYYEDYYYSIVHRNDEDVEDDEDVAKEKHHAEPQKAAKTVKGEKNKKIPKAEKAEKAKKVEKKKPEAVAKSKEVKSEVKTEIKAKRISHQAKLAKMAGRNL